MPSSRQLDPWRKIVKKGTLVASAIVETSTSKRNQTGEKDDSSTWTKKAGNDRHGKNIHIGVDEDSGLIHDAIAPPANVHDVTVVDELLHGDEEQMTGDSGYLGAENHSEKAKKIKRNIMKRRSSVKKMEPSQREFERRKQQSIASKRTKVEHAFGIIKGRFAWRRERKWGLARFEAAMFMRAALANIYRLSRPPKPKKA